MAGPEDEIAPPKGWGRGRLRASDADREQVAGALRAAVVQGRLTENELSARVDQAYASRTYAELAEVIADIPTVLTEAPAPRAPWRATKRAWWFEYAAFLPAIVTFILLPRGPDVTVWTAITFAAVIYPVFWVLGGLKMVAARRVKPSGGRSLPPPRAADREPGPLPADPPPAGPAQPAAPGEPVQPAGFFHAEQVTRTLRTALAQGRLTEEEHDTRAAQVSASRSRAELAPLTADLSADLAARLPTVRDARTAACVSMAAASMLAAFVLLGIPDVFFALLSLFAAATVIVAPPVTVGLLVDARHQKRAGGQLRLGQAPGAGG